MRVTHRSDAVVLLSGSELAILAVGMGEKERGLLLERLREGIATELSRLPGTPAFEDVRGAAAAYGVDGDDPNALVQAARTEVRRELASGTQAAWGLVAWNTAN